MQLCNAHSEQEWGNTNIRINSSSSMSNITSNRNILVLSIHVRAQNTFKVKLGWVFHEIYEI